MQRLQWWLIALLCAVHARGDVERAEVTGWGFNQYGQAYGSPGMEHITYRAIAAGGDHTLALTTNGELRAWGLNDFGQTDCPAGEDFAAIAAGGAFCAALSNGRVVAWGDNASGQLNAPSNVTFMAIAAGQAHMLGLTEEGFVLAWGDNQYGQTDVPSGLVCRAVSAGELHSVGIRLDGSLVAWGNNANGELNYPPGNDYVAVRAGGFHTVALRADGRIVAWGDNTDDQTNCPPDSDFVGIGAGYYHSMALRADGSVVCWGNNGDGQTAAPDGYIFGDVAAGYAHSVALKVPGLICRFSADRTVGLFSLPVQFSAQTSSTNSENIFYSWDFEHDGIIDVAGFGTNAVTHTYTTGVYAVRLFVSNVLEESAFYLRTNYITVLNEGVQAAFGVSAATGALPFTVSFFDQSQNTPQYWQWDYNGDGAIDSQLRNPTYTYTSAGVYTVTLTVSNNFGAGSGASHDTMTRAGLIVAYAPVAAAFSAHATRVLTNEPVQFTDMSSGTPRAWQWDFDGDGLVDSTNASPTHAYAAPGYKTVRLSVSNEFGGDSITRARYITVLAGTRTNYVWESGSHAVPFETWAGAATNLQDAINFVMPGGVVMVSNGVFTSAGEVCQGSNVFVVQTNITVRGCGTAVIDGRGMMRGGYVAGGAVEGLLVQGGRAEGAGEAGYGGGVYAVQSARIERVIFNGNEATRGGGIYAGAGAAAYSCLACSNLADYGGGAAAVDGAVIFNCTLAGNGAAANGGGVHADNATLWNCIAWSNTAPAGANFELVSGAAMHYSCSTPAAAGSSNITADPLFLDGFRIAPESPCVDAGYAFAWAASARDVDGAPRLQGSAPDMGAYESVPEPGLGMAGVLLACGMAALKRRGKKGM